MRLLAGCDVGFTADLVPSIIWATRVVCHSGWVDAAAVARIFDASWMACTKVAGDLSERGYKEIAEAVSLSTHPRCESDD
jgi:hypothetical protein